MGTTDRTKPVGDIRTQLRSLRAQMDVLEARIAGEQATADHTFADLYGMLKGQPDTPPDEIDKALFRRPPSRLE